MPDWSIDHISAVTLAVHDMAESVAFYERLGLHVSYGGPNIAFTTMRAGWSGRIGSAKTGWRAECASDRGVFSRNTDCATPPVCRA